MVGGYFGCGESHPRIKAINSIARKIDKEALSLGDNITQQDVALEDLNDILRYTLVADSDTYVDTFNAVSQDLEATGYQLYKVKNAWTDERAYRGLNTNWIKDDQVFELQFHTPESKAAVLPSHKLYNKSREVGIGLARKEQLKSDMKAIWEGVEMPQGIQSVENVYNGSVKPNRVDPDLHITPYASDRIVKYQAITEGIRAAREQGDEAEVNRLYDALEDDLVVEFSKVLGPREAARIKVNRGEGVWQGGDEPTFMLDLPYLDNDMEYAIANAGELFDQDEVHLRKPTTKLEGDYLVPVAGKTPTISVAYEFEEPIDPKSFLDTYGIGGMTVLDDGHTVVMYEMSAWGGDPNEFLTGFEDRIKRIEDDYKGSIRSREINNESLLRYSRDEQGEETRTYAEAKRRLLPETTPALRRRISGGQEDGGTEIAKITQGSPYEGKTIEDIGSTAEGRRWLLDNYWT